MSDRYRCPECGKDGPFSVCAHTHVNIDGDGYVDGSTADDFDYTDDSWCECLAVGDEGLCGHCEELSAFKLEGDDDE